MDPLQRLRDLAVSESGFLFDPYSGQTYSLNPSGLLALEVVRRGEGAEAVAEALRAHFEVAEGQDLGRDVAEFLRALREQGWPAPGGEDR